ncbi:MAG: hypothetical protein ACQCN4_13620 [Candidatus Bathyarchaeia archaeon]
MALTSSIVIEPSFASPSIPKPSVPQFTVKLVDSSYDIPATTAVDPYTGKTVTQAGSHIESRTIKLYIKRESIEPFIVETSTGNWTAGLQYNIRWKGHFQQDWHEIYTATNGYAGGEIEGEYLVVSYEGKYSSDGLDLYYQGLIARFPPEGQVDFQVEAMVGYVSRDPLAIGWVFNGETSGWGDTQTLTITETAPTLFPSASSSPTTTQDASIVPIPYCCSNNSFLRSGLGWRRCGVACCVGCCVVGFCGCVFA